MYNKICYPRKWSKYIYNYFDECENFYRKSEILFNNPVIKTPLWESLSTISGKLSLKFWLDYNFFKLNKFIFFLFWIRKDFVLGQIRLQFFQVRQILLVTRLGHIQPSNYFISSSRIPKILNEMRLRLPILNIGKKLKILGK